MASRSNILFLSTTAQAQVTTLQPTYEVSVIYLRWLNINSGSPLPDVILLQIKVNGQQVNHDTYPLRVPTSTSGFYPILTDKLNFIGKELQVVSLPTPQKLYDISVSFYDLSGALISMSDAQILFLCQFSK